MRSAVATDNGQQDHNLRSTNYIDALDHAVWGRFLSPKLTLTQRTPPAAIAFSPKRILMDVENGMSWNKSSRRSIKIRYGKPHGIASERRCERDP
jgi:hypothetical protein